MVGQQVSITTAQYRASARAVTAAKLIAVQVSHHKVHRTNASYFRNWYIPMLKDCSLFLINKYLTAYCRSNTTNRLVNLPSQLKIKNADKVIKTILMMRSLTRSTRYLK